jgi:hypothetical protein
MRRRVPTWACEDFPRHGSELICGACLANFLRQGKNADDACLPPRVAFARGWLSVGASHWFEGTDATVFPSRDDKRLLAQTVCGAVCEVTLAYAPRVGRECRKCVAVLRKHGILVPERCTFEAAPERPPQRDRSLDRLH